MDVHAYMAERLPLVDRALEGALPGPDSEPRALHAAMRHLIFPGGKRLRPALAMAACEAVGGRAEQALPVAVAVELVHTYSLIHDDLPCMDDDVLRRGRPTVHVQFGEAVAVLAGDALLTLAFDAVTGSEGSGQSVPADRAVAGVRDLARAAGHLYLVGGQVDDLAFDAACDDVGAIESVHLRKSAALIAASVAGGARFAGAPPERIADLEAFGRELGVAFQIADDVLDEGEGDACSLVRVVGVDASRERAETLLARALDRVDGLGDAAQPLRELARFAVRREV